MLAYWAICPASTGKEKTLNYKILIADDNIKSMEGVQILLQSHLDIEAVYVDSARKAIDTIKGDPYGFAAIVLDYHFEAEDRTGADIARDLYKINQKLQIIICTGKTTPDSMLESLRARVTDFVKKENILGVVEAIRKCFPHYDQTLRYLRREKQSLVTRYSENEAALKEAEMIGRSDKMREVFETIKKSAKSKATVLIRGECGTGKELVARALHKLSERSGYNFVAINCSAIPEALLESELFGYDKGAFTGAISKKVGKFELAHRGTIFLDEIGDMAPTLQAKLLRVLQDSTFYSVGGTVEKKVDVRVLAATNRDLENAVKDGRFREDLYYRLQVLSVNLPPLRERIEDIEVLALHFKEKHDPQNTKKILYRTMDFLKAYSWPGNVRELENTVQRLLTIVDGVEIGPDDLPSVFYQQREHGVSKPIFNYDSDYPGFQQQVNEYMSRLEHDYIISKFREIKNIRETAKALNMSKSTLHRRLRDWGYNLDENGMENEAVGH